MHVYYFSLDNHFIRHKRLKIFLHDSLEKYNYNLLIIIMIIYYYFKTRLNRCLKNIRAILRLKTFKTDIYICLLIFAFKLLYSYSVT
jgi:hypothetical protein